ncbi:hypothetical protein LC065_05290 [Halobacillus litoralis]|uniref:hypothetical protein n=1 Tax=Halobacillus litoralis TaxID=45668 RepID=UPI001CFF17A6|nr:hypothetical protein [Halobacillus litoralis]WLR48604.1 hypothetical protein LC065_05290 [Halobacillus litoralis]
MIKFILFIQKVVVRILSMNGCLQITTMKNGPHFSLEIILTKKKRLPLYHKTIPILERSGDDLEKRKVLHKCD